jgi:hypothetical protein
MEDLKEGSEAPSTSVKASKWNIFLSNFFGKRTLLKNTCNPCVIPSSPKTAGQLDDVLFRSPHFHFGKKVPNLKTARI